MKGGGGGGRDRSRSPPPRSGGGGGGGGGGEFFFFFFPGLLGFCDLDFCRVWGLGGIWETCWRTGSGYFYLCYLYHRLLQGLAGLGTRESIRIHRVRTENIAKLPALHLCMLEP